MKSPVALFASASVSVTLSVRVWIEILGGRCRHVGDGVTLSVRVWIEMY